MGIPKFYKWLSDKYNKNNQSNVYFLSYWRPLPVYSLLIDMGTILHETAGEVYAYAQPREPFPPLRPKNNDPKSQQWYREQLIKHKEQVLEYNQKREMFDARVKKLSQDFKDNKEKAIDDLKYEHFKAITSKLINISANLGQKGGITFVYLAVDGVAPDAKINQQRQRRYRSAMERSESTGPKFFDSNSLTPGTQYMMDMDRYLLKWLDSNKEQLGRYVLYSNHLTPGEGEHKIMDAIRNGTVMKYNRYTHPNHVIYGLDADLILLGLGITHTKEEEVLLGAKNKKKKVKIFEPLPNLRLYREMSYGPNTINIDNLRQLLTYEMKTSSAVQDFILIMSLIGNDFLPSSPGMIKMEDFKTSAKSKKMEDTGLSLMMKAYIETFSAEVEPSSDPNDLPQGITYLDNNEYKINLSNYSKYIKTLRRLEVGYLKLLAQHYKNFEYPYGEHLFKESFVTDDNKYSSDMNNVKFRELWYNNALGANVSAKQKKTNARINSNLDITPEEQVLTDRSALDEKMFDSMMGEEVLIPTSDRIELMAHNYVDTMAWVFYYYLNGMTSINQRHIYAYNHAPLLEDVSFYMSNKDFQLGSFEAPENPADNLALHPIYQLPAVIPPLSIGVLPDFLRPLTRVDSEIYDMFPSNFNIEYMGLVEKDLFKGRTILPPVEMFRIMDAVNTQIAGKSIDLSSYDPPVASPIFRSGFRPKPADPQLDQGFRPGHVAEEPVPAPSRRPKVSKSERVEQYKNIQGYDID